MIQDALFRGEPVRPIENWVYGELGQAVLRLHNEKFRGTSLEVKQEYKPNQVLAYSNIRNISFNERLRDLGVPIHLLSPEEIVEYWEHLPEIDTTYADSILYLYTQKKDQMKN